MKKYEENYGELIEKKDVKEAEILKKEMINLIQIINEMSIFFSLNFDESEKNEIFLEVFNLKK